MTLSPDSSDRVRGLRLQISRYMLTGASDQHWARKAEGAPGCLGPSTASRQREGTLPLNSMLVRHPWGMGSGAGPPVQEGPGRH